MMTRSSVRMAAVTVSDASATSKEVSLEQFVGGVVYIPAAADGLTSIAWHTAPVAGGTYLALYDEDGIEVKQTVSHSKAYAIPSAVWGCGFVKLVGNTAKTVDLYLKA